MSLRGWVAQFQTNTCSKFQHAKAGQCSSSDEISFPRCFAFALRAPHEGSHSVFPCSIPDETQRGLAKAVQMEEPAVGRMPLLLLLLLTA